jgi:predicted nucleic acid-binding protein
MGVILDTSVLISLERGTLRPSAVVEGRENQVFGISVVSMAELLHGVHRATPLARRLKRQAFVEKVIAEFTAFAFDAAAARIYALIWSQLAAKGTQIAAHDLLIGSTAISLGYELLTSNERDFGRIKGLSFAVV